MSFCNVFLIIKLLLSYRSRILGKITIISLLLKKLMISCYYSFLFHKSSVLPVGNNMMNVELLRLNWFVSLKHFYHIRLLNWMTMPAKTVPIMTWMHYNRQSFIFNFQCMSWKINRHTLISALYNLYNSWMSVLLGMELLFWDLFVSFSFPYPVKSSSFFHT